MNTHTLKDAAIAAAVAAGLLAGGWGIGTAIGKVALAGSYPVADYTPAKAAHAANAQVKARLMLRSYKHGWRPPVSVRCYGMHKEQFHVGTRTCTVRYRGLGRPVNVGVRFHEDGTLRRLIV